MVIRERPAVYPNYRPEPSFWEGGSAIAVYVLAGLVGMGVFLCCCCYGLEVPRARASERKRRDKWIETADSGIVTSYFTTVRSGKVGKVKSVASKAATPANRPPTAWDTHNLTYRSLAPPPPEDPALRVWGERKPKPPAPVYPASSMVRFKDAERAKRAEEAKEAARDAEIARFKEAE